MAFYLTWVMNAETKNIKHISKSNMELSQDVHKSSSNQYAKKLEKYISLI